MKLYKLHIYTNLHFPKDADKQKKCIESYDRTNDAEEIPREEEAFIHHKHS